jgi:hypothetical protein
MPSRGECVAIILLVGVIVVSLGLLDFLPIPHLDRFVALVVVIVGVAIAIYLRSSKQEKDCNSDILLVLTAMIAIVFAIALHGDKLGNYMIIALVGVVALSVPLILAVTSKTNLGSRLDNGEIRKAIVISLTVVYIILLVISFYNASLEGAEESNSGVASYSEINKENGSVVKEHSYKVGLTNISAYALELNLSGSTFILKPRINESSGGLIPLTENSTGGIVDVIPEQALADFTKNFLYVYLIIILFYFGSRSWENNKTDNIVKEFMTKYIDSKLKDGNSGTALNTEDLIKFRYALGDIGDREFSVMIGNLGPGDGIKIKSVSLSPDGGDNVARLTISNENKKRGMVIKDISITNMNRESVRTEDPLAEREKKFDPEEQKIIEVKMKEKAKESEKYHIGVIADISSASDEHEYKYTDKDRKTTLI